VGSHRKEIMPQKSTKGILRCLGSVFNSLRSLCVLCASAVNIPAKQVNRRDAEDAEITQRRTTAFELCYGAVIILGLRKWGRQASTGT